MYAVRHLNAGTAVANSTNAGTLGAALVMSAIDIRITVCVRYVHRYVARTEYIHENYYSLSLLARRIDGGGGD